MLVEYSYYHDVACRSKVWIFSKELCARFQAVKLGVGLGDSPLLDSIVDDTSRVTFRFVRELVAGAAPRHGLAIQNAVRTPPRQGFAVPDGGNGADLEEKWACLQRRECNSGPFGAIERLPGESFAVRAAAGTG